MDRNKKFILSTMGIFVSFFFYGIIHEKITKAVYVNPDGTVEKFSYSTSLVLIYCCINFLLARAIQRFVKEEETTPQRYYFASGFTYTLAMICSNFALQFISYPTQVIAKSCKPIPVMICGVLLGKKSFSFKKYLFTGMIVFGVILFMYKENNEKGKAKASDVDSMGVGNLLILSSLFMDGIYAALQERMKADYKTKSLCMMSEINKWATVFILILWVSSKEVFSFVSFMQNQPALLWKFAALSLFGFFGQFSMIVTVTEFGTLPATITATVRKFFTVLMSVLLMGNHLLPRQWLATVIIFSALLLDVLYGKLDGKVK